jgi:hypothetical protein
MWTRQKYVDKGAAQAFMSLCVTGSTNQYFAVGDIQGTSELTVARRNTTHIETVTGVTLVDGTVYDIIVDFVSATAFNVYVDGILVLAKTGDTSVAVPTFDRLVVGIQRDNTPSNFSAGEHSLAGTFNLSPTAAEVKDLISGNIPFKWQYGSQTSVVTGTDSTFAGAGNWVDNGTTTTFDVNSTVAGKAYINFNNPGNSRIALAGVFTVGKKYLISIDADLHNGTGVPFYLGAGYTAGASSFPITPTATETTYTGTIIADGTIMYIGCAAGTAGDMEITLDNVSVLPLGAVALYDQTSISETTWYDKANGNDGAVTGASVLNYGGAHTDGTDLYATGNIIGVSATSITTGGNNLLTLSGGTAGVRLDNTVGIGVAPLTTTNLLIDHDITGQISRELGLTSTFTQNANSQSGYGESILTTFIGTGFTGSNAYGLYINPTFTNIDGDAYSIFVDAGGCRFDGTLLSNGGSQTICDASGNLASANGANFGPADATSFTVVNGIVTAIS